MKFKIKQSVQDIQNLIGGTIKGDDGIDITGINEIHKVEIGDITFVDHPKYYNKSLNSAASLLIIDNDLEVPEGKVNIIVEDPFAAYNNLVNHFYKFEFNHSAIHETAVIGKETHIQPNVYIGANVVIGEGCFIHANVAIYNDTIVGDNVIIHANTSIGSDAFYFKKRTDHYEKFTSCGKVVIEDNVETGSNCTIDKGVSGDTVIGKGTKLDNQVHIAHGAVIGQNCLFAAQVVIAGKTRIADNVTLWGQVAVGSDLDIEEGVVVMAQSGVTRSLKGGKTYFGMPAIEAQKQMRQQASLRKLPELLKKI